jgi:hypothetical protein
MTGSDTDSRTADPAQSCLVMSETTHGRLSAALAWADQHNLPDETTLNGVYKALGELSSYLSTHKQKQKSMGNAEYERRIMYVKRRPDDVPEASPSEAGHDSTTDGRTTEETEPGSEHDSSETA